MKKMPHAIAVLIALTSSLLVSSGQTIFHDTFSSGSTLNTNPVAPTDHSTSYEIVSSKNWSPAPSMTSGSLRFGIAGTTSGSVELQALFTNSAIAIATNGDYVELVVTFVAATNILNQPVAWGFGLYNSGFPQSYPIALQGVAVNSVTTNSTGNAANWQGYWAQIFATNGGGSSTIRTRPIQNGATLDNRVQDLLTTASGSSSFANPGGAAVGTNAVPSTISLTQGGTYTEDLIIGYVGPSVLYITNTLYSGGTTNGAIVATSQFGGIATNTTFLTAGFDSFAIGWRANGAATLIDISSITINSQNSAPTPPVITSEPISASAPLGGSAPFTVTANGINLVYQWMRNGTNVESPNLSVTSGANSSTLLVSPITTADLVSSYSCLIRGAGNLITNTATVALSQRTPVNLVWSGDLPQWDLSNTPAWNNGASVWNYGDNVTFDDSAEGTTYTVNMSNFLSAGTVTVAGSNPYKFQNSGTGGSIAGTARLIYTGATLLNMQNANTYSGGTLMSNASGHLFLANASALGTGPLTNAVAGAILEFQLPGSASSGLGDPSRFTGHLVVNDNLTVASTNNGFAVVIFGDLQGPAGKILTYTPTYTVASTRFRLYGTNTSYDGDIVLNGLNTGTSSALYGGTMFAPYNPSGLQVYNGTISGVGGIIPGDSGTRAIFTGQNTYSGGTTMRTGAVGVGADSTPTSGTVTSGPLGVGAIFVAPDQGGASSTGTIFASGGARTIANSIQYPTATNNQTLQVGGTNALTLSGPITLQANDVPGPTNRTYSVTNTALTTFSGVISSGGVACGLIKTGNGVLALTGAETYTGVTSNSAGRLLINGSTAAASAVNTATNASTGGIGTIGGNLTIYQGGTLSPGDASVIGTLNVSGNLVNNGNILVRVDRSGSLSDQANVTGTLTSSGSGTVTVTNLGADLQVNDTFHVFNKAATGAGTLKVIGAGATWNNNLANDGTISVSGFVATTGTNITFSSTSGNLTLSWPPNYLTWVLQSNIAGLASTNWFNVAGSGLITNITIPIQPNRSNVFYRLVAP